VQGLNTQDAGGTLVSKFLGRLGSLTVNGDFKEASLPSSESILILTRE
jgi:hypothetical protein